MKLFQILTVALCVVMFSSHVQAQEIGRGKLLRKLRDDIFGSQPQQPQRPAPGQTQTPGRNGQQQMRVPTPAGQPGSQPGLRVPTPAGNRSTAAGQNAQANTRAPQPPQNRSQYNPQAGRSFVPGAQQQQQQQQRPRTIQLYTPQQQQQQNANRGNVPTPNTRERSTASASSPVVQKDFGLVVVERDEKLVVAQIAPGGNAATAGLKVGDLITGVGGVDVDAVRDYKEITSEMGPGDQIEFAITSRGKDDKMLVQFGTPPATGEIATDTDADTDSPELNQTVRGNSGGMRSVLNDDNANSFAPQPSSRNYSAANSSGNSANATSGNLQQMQQQLAAQQQTIELLRRELSQQQYQQSNQSGANEVPIIRPPSSFESPTGAPSINAPAIKGPQR